VAESIVTLRVDTRNAVSSLNNASAATNKLSAASRGATKSLAATSTAAKGLGTALRNSIAPILAVGTAFSVLNGSIGTFLARERDIAILEQGLKNLGAGSFALSELQQVADKFGKTTLFNQEDFTRGFNLLTSFRNIGVDSYSRVAQAAADIAQVNQVDVSTSFMQLAKALQDPERNLSNLNRSGIAFTKQQTKVIKELMKTNQVAKAHTMILDIVDESYNQLAQAAAVGFAGSVDTLGEEFRDFGETIGKALIPVIDPAVKGLTALLNFLNSEGGQAAAIIGGIALAAKGLAVVLPILSTNFIAIKTSALIATGQLIGMNATLAATKAGFASATVAATSFKVALAKTGLGLVVIGLGMFVAKLLEANNAQKEFNDLLETGTEAAINQRIESHRKKIGELQEKVAGANKVLDVFGVLIGAQNIGGVEGITAFKNQIKELEVEIKKLEEGLPNAKARDLTGQFKTQLADLKKQNAELTESVQRDQIKGEEAKKQFDLKKQEEQIREKFKKDDADRLVSLLKQNADLQKQRDLIKQSDDAAAKLKETFKQIGDSIATGVSDALVDAVLQTRSLAEAARALLNDIARQFLRLGINTLLSTFGGPFASLPTFANGGRPPVGRASIVGEKGPELFVPTSAGTIIPNDRIGGGITNNIVVNVDASGSNVEGNEQQSRELGLVLSTAIQAQLIQEKRPGGLLA